MTPGHEDDAKLTEQAAQWIELLQERDDQRAAFFRWLETSPRHVEEFLSTFAFMQEIAGLTEEQRERIAALTQDLDDRADQARTNVITLSTQSGDRIGADDTLGPRKDVKIGPRLRWTRAFALAASIVLLAGAGWLGMRLTATKSYATEVGEQRALQLPDGSTIHLNTRSRVAVHFTPRARSIELLEGEALFTVKHDPARPFLVHTGATVVRAIGTQFDVYRGPTGTRVSVLDGVVQISSDKQAALLVTEGDKTASAPPIGAEGTRLKAGESADIVSGGTITRRAAADVSRATAWQLRRLMFREETLGTIAAEFNRYNVRPQIRVMGEVSFEEHFSGTFDVNAPQTLAAMLMADLSLIVEQTPEEIVIRRR